MRISQAEYRRLLWLYRNEDDGIVPKQRYRDKLRAELKRLRASRERQDKVLAALKQHLDTLNAS